ncbi:MAG: enoyl-CoA hydratase [Pseudomonadota bacterium]|nr:enoyl-CoA hydratase [Pseudomonadota bacterium]
MPSELITERRGSTLVLTISDPPTRNTLSAQVIAAGIEALGAAESNDDIRAIVLRGEGTTFCAGGNLNGLLERRAAGRDAQRQMLEHLHHFVESIRAYPKPVLASVEGTAAGAGFSLALACDLVVAAADARFAMSYAKVGLTPDGGATWNLRRALPRPLMLKMIWLGEPVTAELLHSHGLVTTIAPSGRAIDETLRIAERLAAMAPNAIAGAKELIDAAPGHTLAEQLAAERDRFIENLFQDNGEEGLQAFFAKRAPRFS